MRFLAIVSLLACAAVAYTGDKTIFDLDTTSSPSPDGQSVATFKWKNDQWWYLHVKNLKSGHLEGAVKFELTPVFSVQWTGDSNSILVIGHVAHGSTAILFHRTDQSWSRINFFSPDLFTGDRAFCDVVKAETGKHNVNLTYHMDVRKKDSDGYVQTQAYLVKLSVDPSTGQVLKSEHLPAN